MTAPQLEKIALFIDGANLYATAKSLGFDIDYKRLLREFQSRGYLMRAFYYTAVIEDQEYSSIRPLIDWLDYNGYSVVTKATKEFVDQTGRRKVKGNMDIELAVDAMEIAEHIDHMVLFSGDGDFRSLVEAMQRRGVRVTVVSTISTQPPMVADELRRQADIFLDIVELQPKIGRDPAERARGAREPRERHPAIPAAQHDAAACPAGAGVRRRFRGLDGCSAPMPGASTKSSRAITKSATSKPGRDCPLCPRLKAFREDWRGREPDWFNAPVPSFGPANARLLIVGLAPGLHGANRTGRPFTGDYAGDLLYETLRAVRLHPRQLRAEPDDGLELVDARITNAVRCVPPENKPQPAEINTCRQFLTATIAEMPKLARHRHARADRPRQHGRGARPAPLGRAVRARRSSDIGKLSAVRELSLLALQHEYRRADAGDVRAVFAAVRAYLDA